MAAVKTKNSKSNILAYIVAVVLIIVVVTVLVMLSSNLNLSSPQNPEETDNLGGVGQPQAAAPKCFGIRNCGNSNTINGMGYSWNSLDDAKKEAIEECNKNADITKESVWACVVEASLECPAEDCRFTPNHVDGVEPCTLEGGSIIEPIDPLSNNPAEGPYCSITRCKEVGKPMEFCLQVYDTEGNIHEKCVTNDERIKCTYPDFLSITCRAEDKWAFANPTCVKIRNT